MREKDRDEDEDEDWDEDEDEDSDEVGGYRNDHNDVKRIGSKQQASSIVYTCRQCIYDNVYIR